MYLLIQKQKHFSCIQVQSVPKKYKLHLLILVEPIRPTKPPMKKIALQLGLWFAFASYYIKSWTGWSGRSFVFRITHSDGRTPTRIPNEAERRLLVMELLLCFSNLGGLFSSTKSYFWDQLMGSIIYLVFNFCKMHVL